MSDIHGNTERFNSVMKQINLRPEDTLYVLGDVADRYPDGIRILRKLMKMPNVKMLLGNHDFMMLDALYYNADCPKDGFGSNEYFRRWYNNGGFVTHNCLKHLRKTTRAEIFEYLDALPLNIEITVNRKKYLLVHGGIDPQTTGADNKSAVVWYRIKDESIAPKRKTLVFGHTPTVFYQTTEPISIYHGKRLIGIDCGCGYPVWGRLACLRLDDMKEFYSEG